MGLNKCKNCQSEGKLEEIKDYQYQTDEDDPVELLDVFKCPKCGCIHWVEGGGWSWEWVVGNRDEKSAVDGWVTDQQIAKEKISKREVDYA